MVFNLNPSPKYKLIRVNGILTFDNTTDTHLRCKHLFIRAGELHAGSEEFPYNMSGRITLYGEKGAETMVYDNAIEAGNKVIANVNVMKIIAAPRKWKMTRLMKSAEAGSTIFYVEPGLEIFPGDRLALLPTSY
jgi:transcriptional/translational regulatory protein YebC/TACO1